MGDSLRIAFVAGSLGPGGAERQLYLAATELVRRGADVTVHALTRGEVYEEKLLAAGVPVRSLGHRGGTPGRLARLAARVGASAPDVVHASHFFCNGYAAAAARAAGALSVGSLRSDLDYELESNPRWGEALLRVTDVLLSNSHEARERAVRHGVDPERLDLLANAIDLDDFDRAAAAAPARNGAVRVLCVGSLLPVKRVDLFLEAIALVSRDRTAGARVQGIVVGDGPLTAGLARRAAELGLGAETLAFLGRRSDVPALLAGGDVLALCSDHEGLPNVVLEAMAAGLPVVTTPAGDAPRLVEEGVNGHVVAFGDAGALAARLAALAGDAAERHRLGRAGRARVERDFGRDALAPRLLSVYARAARRLGRASLPPPALERAG